MWNSTRRAKVVEDAYSKSEDGEYTADLALITLEFRSYSALNTVALAGDHTVSTGSELSLNGSSQMQLLHKP